MNIVLLGPPGAGKGTQAQRLQRVVHLPHIASGDVFRDIRRQDSELANEIRGFMDDGKYVPDDLTIRLVLSRLDQPDAQNGFLLDGFPRTIPQAEALDRILTSEGRRVELALYITIPPELMIVRIQGRIICPQCHTIYNLVSNPPKIDNVCDVCGHTVERRTDETPEVLQTRLEIYLNQTQPLVNYYRQEGILHQLDGSRPMREVESNVDTALGLRGVS
jgi:adenylate kinase